MKSKNQQYKTTLNRLSELVNEEHVCGCGQASCDINASYEAGFDTWSVYLFDSSGAASDEFRKLFKRLPKRRFKVEAERERKAFIKEVAHVECGACNAISWGDGVESCDSCGASLIKAKGQSDE